MRCGNIFRPSVHDWGYLLHRMYRMPLRAISTQHGLQHLCRLRRRHLLGLNGGFNLIHVCGLRSWQVFARVGERMPCIVPRRSVRNSASMQQLRSWKLRRRRRGQLLLFMRCWFLHRNFRGNHLLNM